MKTRNIFLLTLAAALFSCLMTAVAISAHPANEWYGAKWKSGTLDGVAMDKDVDWRFVDNFPIGDNSRARTRDGASQWSSRGTSLTFNFQWNEPDYDALDWGVCSDHYQRDKVGWGDFGDAGYSLSEPLAVVSTCVFSSDRTVLWSFKMKVNNDAPWYTGTGDVPNNRSDMWSVMSHEFGHAGGRIKGGDGSGHFEEWWDVCPDPGSGNGWDRHTMCPSVFEGTNMMRSLEQHDVDTFQGAY